MPRNTPPECDVRTWHSDLFAGKMRREPRDTDTNLALAAIGLDSVYAFARCCVMEAARS